MSCIDKSYPYQLNWAMHSSVTWQRGILVSCQTADVSSYWTVIKVAPLTPETEVTQPLPPWEFIPGDKTSAICIYIPTLTAGIFLQLSIDHLGVGIISGPLEDCSSPFALAFHAWHILASSCTPLQLVLLLSLLLYISSWQILLSSYPDQQVPSLRLFYCTCSSTLMP